MRKFQKEKFQREKFQIPERLPYPRRRWCFHQRFPAKQGESFNTNPDAVGDNTNRGEKIPKSKFQIPGQLSWDASQWDMGDLCCSRFPISTAS
jgi:hypothetical protein